MPAPAPGDALRHEVNRWAQEGIEVVVSLLERDEVPGLDDRERDFCNGAGVEFLTFPIRDKEAPASIEDAAGFARALADQVLEGRPVAIHCLAGIGRSSVVAACVLMSLGIERASALEMIRTARGLRVPETSAQADWLETFELHLANPPQ